MTAFNVGDRVEWAGIEYTVWSKHQKPGYRWITRDGRVVEARTANLTLIDRAVVAASKPSRSNQRVVAENPHPLYDADRAAVEQAMRHDAMAHDGVIDPNRVRAALRSAAGELRVHPRVLSGMYSALAAQGKIRSLGWNGTNDDHAGGNAGRPMRLWQWVEPLEAAS